jgi:hypothetical protein
MLKTPIVILLTLFLLIPQLADAQATTISMGGSTSTLSATYNTATIVDPNLTITANGTITNFRVQISQTYTSGDVLDFTGTLSGVTGSFNSTTGVLVFTGTASAADWQTLLRTVRFRSTSSTCYANQRRVTFTAGSVYYNPLTSHFYEYVAGNTTWTNAYTVSQAKSYFGRAGYLATIMSEAENNFIWKLMASDAWFGASDDYGYINTAKGSTVYANQSASEGKWHWVTGPEKGQNFSNGNTPSTTLVSGMYHKWAPGEPNGTTEAFGQFYSSNLGQWNDLANSTLGGYICEYGDMPGDLTTSVPISTRNLTISNGSSGYISGGDINVCSGSNSTTLTLNNMTGSVVRWESSLDNFFTAGTAISNTTTSLTVTNITKTTYYRAIVNSTSPVSCSNLASSSVFLSVKPTLSGSVFAANNTICSGGSVDLTLSGQQGNVNKWQRSLGDTNWKDITNITTSLSETIYGLGNGLNMDGSNDYISLPRPTLNNFTIEYWVKTSMTSLTGSQWYNGNGIVDAEVGGSTSDFGTSLLNGKIAFGVGAPDVTIQSTTTVNNGTWYHVAATWDGTTGSMKLYINGVLEASGSGSTGTRSAPPNIRVGSIQTGIQYFSGTVDELRIWNSVRTQSEIQNNMNSEISTSSPLVGYYKFNQGTANGTNSGITSLTDASGNSNTGTLYNFALAGTTSNWTDGMGSVYHYRVEVQTPSCGSAVYSAAKVISVISGTPPNGGSVSSAVHATSTNSGTLTLTSYTGTIVKWQKSTNAGVTWSDISNTAATYSYTNQTDGTLFRAQLTSGTCGNAYSQSGVITVNPFAYSGYAYNAENTGMSGIPVKLYYKDKTQSTYTLYNTYNTDATGKYNITTSVSPSIYDFRIEIGNLSFPSPVTTDAQYLNQKVLTQTFNAKDYYRADANNNDLISITDIFLIYFKISGGISSWSFYSTPNYRIFDSSQWTVINGSNSNLKSTYPGLQTITFSNLTHNGTTNFYIIKTGYKQ